jgi:hypothetical protein
MQYTFKLHNFPIRWTVDADSIESASEKCWAEIKNDMDPESVIAGGFLEVAD